MLADFQDFRRRARRSLPKGLFEYIDRGSGDEALIRRTRAMLDRALFETKALAVPSTIDTAITLMGTSYPAPLIIAPTALAAMIAFKGDGLLAQAAQQAGIPFCVATQSLMSVEAIRAMAPRAPLWFQLYVWNDSVESFHLIERARRCDIDVLVVTVDTLMPPIRHYNRRNGFGMPMRVSPRLALDVALHPRWLFSVLAPTWLRTGTPRYVHYPQGRQASVFQAADASMTLRQNLSWDDLARMRDRWPGRLVIKGITNVADARACRAVGADGLVVSVHGGRNFDAQQSTIEILPAIRAAVGEDVTLLADGGVESGTDALRYIGAGAEAVLMGRAPLYALNAGPEASNRFLQQIRDELVAGMGTIGAENCAAISRSYRGIAPS